MDDQQTKIISITVAIMGALKLILESFQIDLIDDNLINGVSNVVAALLTLWGIWKNHRITVKKEAMTNGQSTFTVPTESTK